LIFQNAPVARGAIVENKRLGAAPAFTRELQASYPPNHRRGDSTTPAPPNNLAAPGMLPTKGPPIAQSSGSSCSGVRLAQCHFNFAHAVTFQPCADMRRKSVEGAEHKVLI
jgi:hypothetical protein